MNKPSFVYLLISTNGASYVGATIDVNRRLRQHNKEIKGGAHATGSRVAKGEIWSRICYISGFPDWSSALQFEWRWKQLSRKLDSKILPLERRLLALKQLLALERSTSKAQAFSEWKENPIINWDDEIAEKIFSSLQ